MTGSHADEKSKAQQAHGMEGSPFKPQINPAWGTWEIQPASLGTPSVTYSLTHLADSECNSHAYDMSKA